jgi:hypothetical protein
MKTTLKSLGCTNIGFIASNIKNEDKRVIIIAKKEEDFAHLVCSEELSKKIRSRKQSVINKLWTTPIGSGLELEVYH